MHSLCLVAFTDKNPLSRIYTGTTMEFPLQFDSLQTILILILHWLFEITAQVWVTMPLSYKHLATFANWSVNDFKKFKLFLSANCRF